MPTPEAQQLAQSIQQEFCTFDVQVKQPQTNPDDSLISVRASGNSFLHHELKRLMEIAKEQMPMIYANEEGLFFMFS